MHIKFQCVILMIMQLKLSYKRQNIVTMCFRHSECRYNVIPKCLFAVIRTLFKFSHSNLKVFIIYHKLGAHCATTFWRSQGHLQRPKLCWWSLHNGTKSFLKQVFWCFVTWFDVQLKYFWQTGLFVVLLQGQFSYWTEVLVNNS